MTIYEFCKEEAWDQLCAIRKDGEIIVTSLIDHEDISYFSKDLENAEVKKAEFSALQIINSNGDKYKVPCLFIDI